MKLINKIKDKFKFNNVDLSRRNFIKNASALAALTVVGAAMPSLFKVKEIQAQISSGLVENQTFYLDEGIIFDIPNLVIRNCYFEATRPLDYVIKLGPNAKNVQMIGCNTYSKGGGSCILIEPQGDTDMATTMQSAIDTASNIKFDPGDYHLNSTILIGGNNGR